MAEGTNAAPAPWPWPQHQLGPLMEIAEQSLTVLQLAELNLQWADPYQSARSAHEWMERNGFDAAPVNQDGTYRYIDRNWVLLGDERTVSEHAKPVDSSILVSAELGLADGISRLKKQPYYFILHGDKLRGIVTRADLQRPAVSMVLFSLILASESAVNVIISDRFGKDESCLDHLSSSRQKSAMRNFDIRKRTGTDVSMLDCLMLKDRLDLLSKCPTVIESLGFSPETSFEDWQAGIIKVRNSLAHGGTLLHAEEKPVSAIELFEVIRSHTKKIWDIAKDVPGSPLR